MPVGLAVGLGGAFGALSRYYLVQAISRSGSTFPWGTLLVNLSGSFLIGVIWGWCLARPDTPDWVRIGLMTGVMGGYTTLSAVSLETVLLLESNAWAPAAWNLAANLGLGVAACLAGLWLGRLVFAG